MINTMILRRFYKGSAFDSGVLKVAGPIINLLDNVAQSILKTNKDAKLPPFVLRARSSGVLNQFGGRRFVEHSAKFMELLRNKSLLPENDDFTVVEIGCGVGRLLRALSIESKSSFSYIGVDIDPVSIDYCEKVYGDTHHDFHLINVSNGAYRPDGKEDPTNITFDMVSDNAVDIVIAWSVFTHMEIDHIRHYLKEISKKLNSTGVFVFSAFVEDDRSWIKDNFKFAYNEGSTVNIENPMKAICFTEEIYVNAIKAAGLELVEPFIPLKMADQTNKHSDAQGQDVFIVRKA